MIEQNRNLRGIIDNHHTFTRAQKLHRWQDGLVVVKVEKFNHEDGGPEKVLTAFRAPVDNERGLLEAGQ